ncbi:MAG: NAD(P)/FAD-dependent oxidoreductase [Deltaproteobacteria bacterium]|nr:NAD(P)/FAD-dependent oxidoreductase [Deltaproteobacteria bacterium]
MAEKYDVIVAGGGHNGLTTGAYLAKAGLNVCVLELQDKVGGGVITRELTEPGYLHDHCSTWHGLVQANPLIRNDELGLISKYGLEYLYPELYTAIVFPDNRVMKFYRDMDKTCESIAEFSQHDADAYRKFYDWSVNLLDMFTQGMFAPPPPQGAFTTMMDQSDEGREMLRAASCSGMDICDEWFEDDHTKIAMTRFVAEGMVSPQTKGTGMMLFLFIPLSHKYGGGVPIGGSGVLSDALARCIEDNGGTIRTECPVKSFKFSGNECTGVILESGEEIDATKAVVSNLNIKQMFPAMCPGATFPDNFIHRVDRLEHSEFMGFNSAWSLHEHPKYTIDGIDQAMWVQMTTDNLSEALKIFDGYRYGIPETVSPLAICTTLHDKTRAPEGKHCLYFYHFEPYNLADGGPQKWDEIGESVCWAMMDEFRKITTNMGDENMIGKPWFTSPLDIERWNPAMIQGDIAHIGYVLSQQSSSRPMYGYGQFRMPFEKMYLTGSSGHPGAGVTCGGRAPAMVIMEDLDMDFEDMFT